MKYYVRISVIIILKRGKKALLTKRQNTGYEDNKYEFVSGHLNENETIFDAAIREVKEEVNISITMEDLKFIGCIDKASTVNHINFVFEVENFNGEPEIMEPEECAGYIYLNIENEIEEELSVDALQALEIYKEGKYLKSY